jgi:ribosomal-protein-alanine N-acetyltransferase
MTEPSKMTGLSQVKSRRLNIVAATTKLIKKDIEGSASLATALGVQKPESWPPSLYGPNAMRFALLQLDDAAEQSWSFWYLITNSEPSQLAGICGFKGRPDHLGSVEIGYSVIENFQRQGLATEAVERLVGWAFSHHNVTEVCAETFPYLSQSIRVLEKNGFELTGPGSEAGVVRYAVKRSSLK